MSQQDINVRVKLWHIKTDVTNNIIKNILCFLFGVFCVACANDGTVGTQAEYEQGTPRADSSLIMPPGLTAPSVNSTYKMLYINPTESEYKLDKVTDMHIVQGGSERWLVIKDKNVNQVFPTMIAYLRQQGVHIKYQNPSIGLIQTDWFDKNNVAKSGMTHQFFAWIGLAKAVNALPSMYAFRVNLWQNKNNTEIFVTDYQMNVVPKESVAMNKKDNESANATLWMSIPPNPQLELDFLLQFMAFIKLGPSDVKPNLITPTTMTTSVQVTQAQPKAARDKLEGTTLTLNDSFDRAWWRTGIALERVGLGVADKNRILGEFYVYPLQENIDNPDPSTFSRWFGDDKSNVQMPKAKYTIKLVTNGTGTNLTFELYSGVTDDNFAKNQQKYLLALATQLK